MLYLLGLSYGAVQAVAGKVPGRKQTCLLDGYRTGADVTSVRCGGKWLPLGSSVDAIQGLALSIDSLPGEETGRARQVCKSHVGHNTDALVEELSALIQAGHDHSLKTIRVSSKQALADLVTLQKLVHSRQPEEQSTLEQLYLRHAAARKPARGRRFDIAYRMCNLFLDR